MKIFLRFAIITLVLSLFPCHALAADPAKVGVVDVQKFQAKSAEFQKIKARLQKTFDAMQKKLDDEKTALQKLEEEYRKQSMMLSLDAQQDKRNELEKKKRYYKYLYEDYTFEMKDAEAEATRMIGKELEGILKAIGEKQGFVLILEKRTPGLLYFDKAADVTDIVIQAYDQQNKKK